jgi:hypothetical protein
MAMPWFRFYHEFANDPKVQEMPEVHQRRLVMIFCLKACDVLVTLRDRSIAFHLRITEQELAESKQIFMANGFITESWEIVNWAKRQYVSDSSTDRTRRYRERRRTSQERHIVTDVTKCDGLDTDTDTDTEQIKNSSRAKKARVTKKKNSTKTEVAKSRHAEFKNAIFEYWKSKNEVDCPWQQPEGMQLEMWLKSSPSVTVEQFMQMLRHRYKSEVNHAERPSIWIRHITGYANGPLDRFRNPLGGSTQNGTNRQHQPYKTKWDRITEQALALVDEENSPDAGVEGSESLSGGSEGDGVGSKRIH